jgi:hypothetical protein
MIMHDPGLHGSRRSAHSASKTRVNALTGLPPHHEGHSPPPGGLRRKPEMHHVAVGDHVVLAFEPHLAGVARAGLAAERHVVLI